MREHFLRKALMVFLVAIVGYVALFTVIERLRVRKGPWRVEFACGPQGEPSLRVQHDRLGVERMELRFVGETCSLSNSPAALVFDRPTTQLPFGQILFLDTTFLPGTIAMNLFGHEVELFPTALILNRRRLPWQREGVVVVRPEEKLPPEQVEKSARRARGFRR